MTHLMCSAYEVQVVPIQKLGDNIGAKSKGDPAVVLAPPLHVLVRVGPEEVAEQARVGYICGPHNPPGVRFKRNVTNKAVMSDSRIFSYILLQKVGVKCFI